MSDKTKQTIWIVLAVVVAAALMLVVQRWMGSQPPATPVVPGQEGAGRPAVPVRPTSYEPETPAAEPSRSESDITTNAKDKPVAERATATFGGGCFWCTEAVFRELKGVHSVVSGYSGGRTENPTYEQVLTGRTGHAEVIQIEYDPSELRYEELLEVFFSTHDPTTHNRQGNDVGPQYRSVIFFHDEEQEKIARDVIKELRREKVFPNRIVTDVDEFEKFYPAEDYHQEYFANNADKNPYCAMVVRPKVEKFRKVFAAKLKEKEEAAK
jgi:peptide-methionine (S)-S-oxide reductase